MMKKTCFLIDLVSEVEREESFSDLQNQTVSRGYTLIHLPNHFLILFALIAACQATPALLHHPAVVGTGASSQYRSQDNFGNYNFGYDEGHLTEEPSEKNLEMPMDPAHTAINKAGVVVAPAASAIAYAPAHPVAYAAPAHPVAYAAPAHPVAYAAPAPIAYAGHNLVAHAPIAYAGHHLAAPITDSHTIIKLKKITKVFNFLYMAKVYSYKNA
ncbi:hypothetical protein CEXT_785411 [Caerostris extrusa]|uniref:Cuticle protein n=1 Tax=Caerostris extrusa TaxID=172846 RepID=A0AAV4NXE1_CAEEX|nr:hypothetical protein CEXT_785411 [Caerostris extrusa]